MAAPVTFESVWEEFTAKVRPYNTQQKRQILHEVRIALSAVINSMPAPRREGAEDPIQSPTGSAKRLLPDLESLLYDRMQAAGEDKSLWLRWDTKATGSVTAGQFKASVAALGMLLTEEELAALISKFPSSTIEGGLCYHDLYRYLQAQAETPRSTAQSSYNPALLNRPSTSGKAFATLLAGLQPDSVEARLARGLKALRESMYQKSSNFHDLFLALQNKQTKLVAINDLIPHLTRLGFPRDLCTEQELHDVASLSSHKTPGSLTYGEFLAFCTGHDALSLAPGTAGSGGAGANDGSLKATPPGPLDSPALLNALMKINNLNLRKVFKECDTDNDGLITTAQLAQGLIEQGGLHPSVASDPAFLGYAETYCQRKPGHFGYAEFLKFVNTRSMGNTGPISGLPLQLHASASAAVRIPEEATPASMLEAVVKALRGSQVSVESVFQQFDCDFDGHLDEAEFYLGLSSLGFSLSPLQSKQFFDALDTNKNGAVDVHEFAQLIVNPAKHPKLSTRVRQAPGGASTVPLGSYAPEELPARPQTGRAAVHTGRVALDLSQSQTPLSSAEQQAQTRPQSARYKCGEATLDLSFPQADAASAASAAAASAAAPAGSTQGSPSAFELTSPLRGRNPPGGKSSIDFVNDHGHVTPNKVGGAANKESDVQLLHFDPLHPVAAVPRRTGAAGREATIQLTDTIDEEAALSEPLTPRRGKPLGSPKLKASNVSFNQADSEPFTPGRKVLASPGGFSDFSLAIPERPGSPSPVDPVRRPQDELNIDLAFHPEGVALESPRRVRGVGATPNQSTVNLAHSAFRVDGDLDETHHMAHHKQKKHLAGSPLAIALGNEQGSAIRAAYQPPQAEVDPALIEQLSQAVHAHSQRLRYTFQEWNKSSQSATLSKENFLAGARSLNVNLSEADATRLFERFDADGDDSLSYSEFVRLLAVTK